MLDDNLYNDNLSLNHPQVNGFLSNNTLEWINYCGKLAKDRNLFIFEAITTQYLPNYKKIRKYLKE